MSDIVVPGGYTGISEEIVKVKMVQSLFSLFGERLSLDNLSGSQAIFFYCGFTGSVLCLTLTHIPRKIQNFTSLIPLSYHVFKSSRRFIPGVSALSRNLKEVSKKEMPNQCNIPPRKGNSGS